MTCDLGTIKSKKKVTVTIVVMPALAGKAKDTATVTSAVSDPNPGDDSATVKTKVT